MRRKLFSKGYTLVELLSVFAIGGSIIIMGMRFYNTLKRDSDIRELQNHVNLLFSAAKQYYLSNCMLQYDPLTDTYPSISHPADSGTLDPRYITPIGNNETKVLSIENDLVKPGYLKTYPFLPYASLVNNTDPKTAYVVQLTRYDTPFNYDTYQTSGTIVHWSIQVSVKLAPNSLISAGKAKSMQYALNANCLADSIASNGKINNCQTHTLLGPYAVWEKTPAAIYDVQSNLSLTKFYLMQFKSLYTLAPNNLVNTGETNYLLCTS